MPRQTKFAEQWLDQVDANQHTLRWWCKAAPKDIYAAFCTLCYKTVPCDNMGLIQLLQHAKGKKHMEIANVRFSQRQQHLVVLPTSAASNIASEISSVGAPSMFCVAKSHKDQVSMAEIRWCLHVVQNDLPFAASDNVGDLFKLMFPSDPVAKDFTCGATKTSYIITHGLAPYFRDLLLADVKKSNTGFTVHYDETTTIQIKKQLDVILRYWSLEQNKVVVHYVASLFFGHAEAKTVTKQLLGALADNGLPVNKLIALSSDGPNVNKAITNLVNKELTDSHLPMMVDIGSCNLHKVHNAFAKGLVVFGQDAEDLALKLFYWFKHSAARREDLQIVQFALELDSIHLLRHVESRWLSLQPAVARILSQWPALLEYFKHLPDSDKSVEKNGKYKEIMLLLINPRTYIQLVFIADVASVFSNFLQMFQREGPLIHTLYFALNDLVRTLMLCFVNTAVVGTKMAGDLVAIDVNDIKNLRTVEDMEIGEATRHSLSKIKKEQQKGVLLDMRKFLSTTVQYLQTKLPLTNGTLRDLQCLQPTARSKPESEVFIRRLARKLPQVISQEEVSAVTDEWKVYSVDDIPRSWYCVEESAEDAICDAANDRPSVYPVDQYWAKVLAMRTAAGDLKYKTLGKAVMASLALSHGNADAERGFSTNKKVVTADRSRLCEGTINAVRLLKDAMRCHGGLSTMMSVTPALVRRVQGAHSRYKEHLEEEQRNKEMMKKQLLEHKQRQLAEEQKKKEEEKKKELRRLETENLQKKEREITVAEMEQRKTLSASGVLLQEAEGKLSDAIKAGDMDQISVAHAMIEIARKRMNTATNELSTLANKRKVCVDKKKRHLDSSLHNESPDPPTKKAKSSKRDGKE